MDISDLNNVRTVHVEKLDNWAWSILPVGDRLYVAAKWGGLIIYDISDPAVPQKLAQYLTGQQTIQLQVEENLAYIADGPGGLLVLDISDASLPREVSRFTTRGFSQHVFKSGNYVYLSNRENGLLVINVSDPSAPYLETQYQPKSETYCSFKKDVYVYLSTNDHIEVLRHNNQPILEPITDATIDENSSYRLQLHASDPDGDPIIFEADNLPEGSRFDPQTGLFNWTPNFEQSGIYPGVIFRVVEKTGSQLSAADTINITVNHVNRLPVLPTIVNQSVKENTLLTFTQPEATDPDSEDIGKLTYRAENLPEGASFNAASRVFSWTPTYDQSGTYMVDFVVTDGGGGSDRNAVKIEVEHVDRPPVLQPVADLTVDEGKELRVQLQGSEPDKEDLSKIHYTLLNKPEGAVFDTRTGAFSWTPTYDQSGLYQNLTAIMTAGAFSDSTTFSITVNHVNRAPVLQALSDQTVAEDNLLTFKIVGTDPDVEDAGKLTFSAANLPEGAQFEADSQLFTWKPTFEQAGSYSGISFTVKDPAGLSDSKSITITVNNVDRAPTLEAVPPLVTDENQPLSYQLQASDPDKEDAGRLTFSAALLPQGASLDASGGAFGWQPTFDQAGEYPVTFSVSDGELQDSKPASITVKNINRPPVLETADGTVDENSPLTIQISANDPDKEDTGKLTVTVQNLPEGAVFNPANRTIQWTPTFDQAGSYPGISVTVTDAEGLTDSKNLAITVNNVNRPPQIGAVPPVVVSETEPVAFTLSASDPDKEDQGKLQFQISPLPEGATLDAGSGAFAWTPTYEQSGQYNPEARVQDVEGRSATTPIRITVQNKNRPPVVQEIPSVTGKEDEPISVQLQFSDPDGEDQGKLRIKAQNLPGGVSLDSKSGLLKWKPGYDQSGNYTINYTVTDAAGAAMTGRLEIEVENVNRPPSLGKIGNKKLKEGETVTFTLSAKDPDSEDAGKLQFSADNLPQGADFNSNSGTFSWTPGMDQQGEYQLTFSVKDTGGLSDQKTIKITVQDVPKPVEEGGTP